MPRLAVDRRGVADAKLSTENGTFHRSIDFFDSGKRKFPFAVVIVYYQITFVAIRRIATQQLLSERASTEEGRETMKAKTAKPAAKKAKAPAKKVAAKKKK